VDLDPLDIVERAEILDIIAYAIDEKIGGCILSPDGDLVAIAFTLADRSPRRIAENIADILKRLIIKLFAGYHRDRLRRIDQRRVGFQAGAADRNIAFLFPGHDDLLIICNAICPGFLGRCLGRNRCNRDQTDRRKNAERTAWHNIHKQTPSYENYSQQRAC